MNGRTYEDALGTLGDCRTFTASLTLSHPPWGKQITYIRPRHKHTLWKAPPLSLHLSTHLTVTLFSIPLQLHSNPWQVFINLSLYFVIHVQAEGEEILRELTVNKNGLNRARVLACLQLVGRNVIFGQRIQKSLPNWKSKVRLRFFGEKKIFFLPHFLLSCLYWGWNPGPFAHWASALPVSYCPRPEKLASQDAGLIISSQKKHPSQSRSSQHSGMRRFCRVFFQCDCGGVLLKLSWN